MTYRTSNASASFVATAELDLACTYALRRPDLARACALYALTAAIDAGRPDLAYRANSLLGAL